jgi:hypothetical protein
MKYRITAAKSDHRVEQEADTDQLMKKWLQIFRRNSWKVEQVVEIK